MKRSILATVTAVALLAFGATSASAATTMTLVGTSVTILGDAAPEVVVLEDVGGMLQHNRSTDPGYNSAMDFDSSVVGDQTLAATALTTVSVQLAGGPNSLVLKDGGAVGRTWSVGAATVASPIAMVSYDNTVSGLSVQGGTGVDTISVLASSAATPITLETGAGADTVAIGSAAGTMAPIMGAVKLTGGASTDSVVVNDTVGTADVTYRIDQEPGRTNLSRTVPTDAGVISWDGSVATLTLNAGTGRDKLELIAPPATSTVMNVTLGRGDDTFEPRGSTNLGGGTLAGGEDTSASASTDGDRLDLSRQSNGVTIDMPSGTAGAFGPMSGFEQVIGTDSPDFIRGSSSNERFAATGGDDVLSGGGGDDYFVWFDWSGNDTFTGDGGYDVLDGSSLSKDVSITLDGVANDGATRQTSNVGGDIEVVISGSGTDVLIGNDQPNDLRGEGGADLITGGVGDDLLAGGNGSDVFLAGSGVDGADTMSGGPGTDTVDYSKRRKSVSVTLDAKSDDGTKGEKDAVLEMEHVFGGRGSDTITGNAFANQLWGGLGNDRLTGGKGKDRLSGNGGNDTLDGGSDRDVLNGNAGADRFTALDRAIDTINGGAGIDVVVRRDRTDIVRLVP